MWRWILLLTFPTSLNLPQRYSTYYRYLLVYLTLPISARDSWYQSAFCIQEQPQVYLPWFSWIRDGRREATAGSPVVYGEESKVDWSRWSAACYLVSFAILAYIPTTDEQFWWKVLFCSEQCSASIATGINVLWDSEGRNRFLSPIFQAFIPD